MRPDPSRRPGRPPTSRAGAPGTARGTAGRPPAAPKSKTPVILACAGGGVLLLIILFVAFSGDEPKNAARSSSKPKAAVEDAPKKVAPDVSKHEAEGKQKCDEGLRLVESRVNPDSSASKEQVRKDLERGIELLNDGLAAYKKAAEIAGKKYDLERFNRARNVGITLFCTDLEKEAVTSCDQGLALIKNTAGLLTGRELTDEEKKKLKDDLSKGKSLISAGFDLMSRVERVSGRKFDQGAYQEALLIARKKLPELQ